MKPGIPRKTVYRLSMYMRCLEQFHENGVQTASSHSLAQAAGVKPTQLRKDLSSFGHFGTRGLGVRRREAARQDRRGPRPRAAAACRAGRRRSSRFGAAGVQGI
ncbi:MAG: winged-helix domain-containing protein [Verrucomicrobiia bacterium]